MPHSLEAHIGNELAVLFPDLEQEPAAAGVDFPVTYTFATTGRADRLTQTGILALHFYGATPLEARNASAEKELAVEMQLSGTESHPGPVPGQPSNLPSYAILSALFDTRLPIDDEETGEFINIECTYVVQYTIRRA